MINIDHYPARRFILCGCTPIFSVDLNQAVKEKLKNGEQLTNATALRILKEIKWKSDIRSFLTKPIVAISVSLGVLIAGLCIPTAITVLTVTSMLLQILGAGMLGYSLENYWNDFLPDLSRAYSALSQKASEHITVLEAASQEMQFVLA